jgi:hypothetical protein
MRGSSHAPFLQSAMQVSEALSQIQSLTLSKTGHSANSTQARLQMRGKLRLTIFHSTKDLRRAPLLLGLSHTGVNASS